MTDQRITVCQVIVEAPSTQRHEGAPFNVKIALRVPGADINVHSDPLHPPPATAQVLGRLP